MKKILLRSKTTPFDVYDPITFIDYDKCSSNLGNLLYQHSVYKHLSTNEQIISINNNSVNLKKVDSINKNFDHFVVPLANAFRPAYLNSLVKLTEFIKRLTIPVTVVGVGAQTDFTGNFDNLKPINEAVYNFVSTVLEKSKSIGVRGEITKKYLISLGIESDRIDIIGCPSLFTSPRNIMSIKKQGLDETSKIAFNLSATGNQAAFSDNLSNFEPIFSYNFFKYLNTTYIPQETRSLELLTYGFNKKKGIEHSMLSKEISERVFQEGRVRFFLNSYSWFDFLKKCDFTIGTRLHGCIASLIAGKPALLFAHDSRTLEIAEYFKIPYKNLNNFHEIKDIAELYDQVNLEPMQHIYKDRLSTYANFLRKNGLDTIVDKIELMDKFEENIMDIHKGLSVSPLQMNNHSIGQRLHWIKESSDFKIAKIKAR